MAYAAKVIADSVCSGHRLTTMELTHPRIVHAEFMTHCMFSRNASSSRAIPFAKMVAAVQNDPFIPIHWGRNQSGMQAREELDNQGKYFCETKWLEARNNAVRVAESMSYQGLHKQICNRLLEPWSWITVLATGDKSAWSNYFALRCPPYQQGRMFDRDFSAQPEIQVQAYMARDAYLASTPRELRAGEWHLPYMDVVGGDATNSSEAVEFWGHDCKAISVGRCARVSYLTQDGKRDPAKDVELHDRLLNAKPMHASPFEHCAQAIGRGARWGKYTGWKPYRHMLPGEYTTDYFETLAKEAKA